MEKALVTPGEVITSSTDIIMFEFDIHSQKTFFLFWYFSGHNVRKVEDKAVSSTLGKVDVVDKLVIVKPLKSRFIFFFFELI